MASTVQSEQAYLEIRRRLLKSEIPPAVRIREQEWAGTLNVGRTAIREALNRLHGEGVVKRGAKGGFFASVLSFNDFQEILEAREALEMATLRLAEKKITAKQIRELEAACREFAYMIERGYYTGAWEVDRRFHHLLVAAGGNSRLVRAYEQCHLAIFPGHAEKTLAEQDYAQTIEEHRAIVDALKSRNFKKAVEVLRAHLSHAAHAVLSHQKQRLEK